MRTLRGLWRRILFVVNVRRVEKHAYSPEMKVAGWLASIELPGFGVLAFEDTEGRYRFTW